MSDNKKNNNQKKGMGFGPRSSNQSGEKAKNFKKGIGELYNYLKEYRLSIFVVILFAAASAAFSIYGPKLLGKATTKIYEGVLASITGTGSVDFNYIGKVILFLAGLYIISAILAYIQGYIMTGIAMKVSYKMRKDISKKLNRLPLNYFDSVSHGEVLSRVTNDVDTVNQTLNQSLSQLITSATTVIGVLIMMLSISVWMTLVAIIMVPLSMILIVGIVKKSQKYFKEQQDYLGNVNGHVEEMYSGHLIIKAFNKEKASLEKFNEYNNQLYSSAWKSQFLSSLMMPVMNIVSNLGYVAICILGGALAVRQMIEIGDIQAFIQYIRNFTRPISQLANVSNILQQTVAASERVFEFLAEDEEVSDEDSPNSFKNVKGDVSFNNVYFGYEENKNIINDFSVDVKAGQKIAIVGPTGAGKTTIVKLLMRFYDIDSGSIKVDGIDIRHVKRDNLRKQFAMVLQDTWLYNTTIMENIRYGNQKATDEEVIRAAQMAHVDSFVHMLPDGYNMILNEDATNISRGQKQLLTIARAILADPKILILDEATSSVDTRTEVQIQKAMANLMENKTSFIIAHRLSTIKDADVILVMDKGDIVQQGSHNELLAKKGFYAKLYNSQFENKESA